MQETPRYEKMASGNYEIVLQEDVSEISFSMAARRWASKLELQVGDKVSGGNEIVWCCTKNDCSFWLSWDIWFPQVGLQPQDDEAEKIIFEIGDSLGCKPPDEPDNIEVTQQSGHQP